MSSTRAPAVPAGTAVYAIGDVHGRADLLDELLARIVDDPDVGVVTRRVIVYLGDYVDRGADSARVIDLALDATPPGFESVALLGNHEQLMLEFLEDTARGGVWLTNGGDATLRSYGIAIGPEPVARDADLSGYQAALRAALPARHKAFLETLCLRHIEGDYFFVHAGIRPGVPLTAQRAEDMIWIRNPFLESAVDHGRIVVHGHTIVREPEFRSNRIGIDTGAFASGRLTCLALEGTKARIIATGG